jgi:hypothetical protein
MVRFVSHSLMQMVIIYGGAWHRRGMFFSVKRLLIQTLKSPKTFFTQTQISIKK